MTCMTIFFNGCSITWGDELEEKEDQRYSTLIGHQLDADVVNIAQAGVSNDWIVEKTISWFSDHNADLAIIQFTEPSRWIWYDPNDRERRICIQKSKNLSDHPEEYRASRDYYKSIYSDLMGIQNRWKNQYILETFFKFKKIPYIFVDMKSHHHYEKQDCNWKRLCAQQETLNLMWNRSILESHSKHSDRYAPNGHPSAKGHQRIAKYLIDMIEEWQDS